jgi:hypothetical protein
MARHQTGGPVRITTANASRNADIAARQKRYLLAMGFRTVCFVAAIFVTAGWLRVVLIIAALVLPYVAVVMANAGSTKSDGFALLSGPSDAPELPPGTESGDSHGQDHL